MVTTGQETDDGFSEESEDSGGKHDCGRGSENARSELREREALWDLFQSKVAFLHDHLMVLKNVYMDPLKKVQVEGYVMFAEPELLFGNLDELCCVTYAFCKEFMTLLLQSMNITMPTAEILVKLFQKWCNRDPRCKKLQLTDLLVAPVQHIMKVPLLLKEIEGRTENMEDRDAVNHILEREEASLRELDDKMKWLKNFERLLEIQRNLVWPSVMDMEPKMFVPDFLKIPLTRQPCERLIVSPRRQIVLEGPLSLMDAGKPADMHLILFDDMLLITRKKKGLGKKPILIKLSQKDEYEKKKPAEIPKLLEDFLVHVAKTGDTVFPWSKIKYLLRQKLDTVMTSFHATCPTEDLPPCPNVDPFNYQTMRDKLLEQFDYFSNAPFSIQRLCELLTTPKRHYKRTDKFMRGLEKNLLVVSTSEPGQSRRVSENNTSVLNGNEGSHDSTEIGSSSQAQLADGETESEAPPVAPDSEVMLGHPMTVNPDSSVETSRPSHVPTVPEAADSGISDTEKEGRPEAPMSKLPSDSESTSSVEKMDEQTPAEAAFPSEESKSGPVTKDTEQSSMDMEKEPSSSVTVPEPTVTNNEVATTMTSNDEDTAKATAGKEHVGEAEAGQGMEKLQLASDSEGDSGNDSCAGSKRPLEVDDTEGGERDREFKVARTKSPEKLAQELAPFDVPPKDIPDEVSTTAPQPEQPGLDESPVEAAVQPTPEEPPAADVTEPTVTESVMEET
nr:EOG090X0BWU [Triops cancriformis]